MLASSPPRRPVSRRVQVPATPVAGGCLVGRSHELAELRRTLGTARLVTLTGQVGIGKTVLARAAAADHARVRREDTWTVDLADLVDPDLLAASLAEAFGVRPTGSTAPQQLAAAVADRVGLLVLDGCEALYEAVVPMVPLLLRSAPRLRVLATSRRQLGVSGETVVPVGPLAVDEAQTLFVARATAALPTFRLTEDNAPTVARLCAALECVPLAVELAAARVRVLPPQGILERLSGGPGNRQRLLAKGAPTAPTRHRSLHASLEASSELCTAGERRMWARLAVFTGGFELAAAEATCAGGDIDEADVLDLVDGLLEKSVLVRDDDGATYVRFRMPEALREFGVEQLSPLGQPSGRERHLAWFAGLARSFAEASFGPRQAEWYDVVRREHGNLRSALRHALGDPRHATLALEMVSALAPFWIVTGRLDEARHWLGLASSVADTGPRTRAEILAMSAWVSVAQGDPDTARSLLDEVESLLADVAPDDVVRAQTQNIRALELLSGHDPAAALPELERGVVVARTVGGRPEESSALLLLGLGQALTGDLDLASATLRECVGVTEPAGEAHVRSYALAGQAACALLRANGARAADAATEALAMATRLGDHLPAALALEVLARLAVIERRPERAATLHGAADSRWRRRGLDPAATPLLTWCRQRLDEAARAEGHDATFRAASARGAELTDQEVLAHAREQAPPEDGPDHLDALTRRELEIARLIGAGLSNRQIADRLGRSQRTVESHVEHILRKLGFGSRTQVAAWVADQAAGHR